MMGAAMRWVLLVGAVAACAAGVAATQPKLAAAVIKIKHDEIAAIPPPEELRAMSLGYRTVGADLLWAKLIVEHGLHWEEKRAFPDLANYIDGIIALDPEHPILYEFVDTLLLFNANGGGEPEARLARKYLEQAANSHPHDPNIWLRYGQYVAFLGPSFLKERADKDQWRRDGALAIAKAVDLGADPDRGLSAWSLLSRYGERSAAVAQLQRAYALSDDPETRERIAAKLAALESSVEAESAVGIVEHQWRTHYPALSRSAALLLGPHRSAAACAGLSADSKECPRDWSAATREGR